MVITLLRKVPPGQSDHYPVGEWSFARLVAFFEQKIAALNAMVADGINLDDLAATITDKLCPICEGEYHAPERCPLPPHTRLGLLMFLRRPRMYCLNCLEPMKWSHDCGAPKCTTCGGDHHAALCCPDVGYFETWTYPFECPKRQRDDPKEPEKETIPEPKQPDEPQVAPYQHSLSPMPQSEYQLRDADWPFADDRPFTVC